MPTYIYECPECHKTLTKVHSMSDDPLIKCDCGATCFRAIQPVIGYVRGNCYLNKEDCRRQATISMLKDNDPYIRHRQPGERDELINKIKNKPKNRKVIQVKK